MRILAINCGSSSVKFQLFDTSPEQIRDGKDRVIARGGVERIGHPPSVVHFQAEGRPKRKSEAEIENHQDAIEACLACLIAPEDGPLESIDEIDGVGHRIVHGGEYYSDSVLIDDDGGLSLRRLRCAPRRQDLHVGAHVVGSVAAALPAPTSARVISK